MKILFFGTPKFGADVLEELLLSAHEVIGVVCQTDKKGNRNKTEFCEVKRLALEKHINVYQFENVNEHAHELENLCADIFVTAAYGQILSRKVIDAAKYGTINVHPSLLPKYRGATPVQAALLNGDTVTGVSVVLTAEKLDAGDILEQSLIEIAPDDNSMSLLEKTAKIGGELLVMALDNPAHSFLSAVNQDEGKATYTRKITTETCKIDFGKSAGIICNQIRALSPEPSAFYYLNGMAPKILKAQMMSGQFNGENGEIVKCGKDGLFVKCGVGTISLLTVQLAGGKVLDYKDFVNGRKIALGDMLK